MKASELRPLLERLVKAEEYKCGAQAKLVEAARQFAMLTKFNCMMENGVRVHLCNSDAAMNADYFKRQMEYLAFQLIVEEATPI